MVATHEDAALVLQLMRWGTETGLEEALGEIFSPEFDAEHSSMANPSVRKVLYFGEIAGALVHHHVMDRDLLRDTLWFDGIWPRVRRAALAMREESGEPKLYENFELLVDQVHV
jgi:hypothetical protein